MRASKGTFIVVVLITLILSWVAFFGFSIPRTNARLIGASDMRFGIDIRGGVDVSFAPKDLDRAPTQVELEAVRSVIETRLDQKNILDRDVTLDTQNGLVIVRFPWKSDESDFDPAKAISELGAMARLTFRDPANNVIVEGKDVISATSGQDESGQSVGYVVHLKFNSEAQKSFAEATGRLINQSINIFMDDTIISDPIVERRIDSPECVINGIRSAEEAMRIANQINSGALPFSLTTDNFSTISPQLGSNALGVMVTAGLWAFILICIALMIYYRASGIVASISLLLQIAGILLMITWPQITMTLPGIAGIILSIGMGVDANIIVSERIREELKSGKSIENAVNSGFKKAFSSVFDGNITVLIVAVIMMIFGSGAMLSFAYTLLFGIIMNFVAGVTATRLMTTSLIKFPFMHDRHRFISERALTKTQTRIFPFYQKRRVFFLISTIIIIFGIVSMMTNGVILDIQFKGGTILRYDMSETIDLSIDDAANVAQEALPDHIVSAQVTQNFATGDKRLALSISGGDSLSNEEMEQVTVALQKAYPDQQFDLIETNSVTPFFGAHFLQNAMIALVLSALLIILYVWFSFRKIHGLSAGVMALVSLLHDVLVVFFAFVAFRIPIGDSFVAVALTILGYSINDTIVIYDRIRENAAINAKMPMDELVDTSISQSFTRSLNTNLAVFCSVAIMFFFALGNGLESIRTFALPMTIGTISGCYSTVCIAGPLWTMWQKHKQGAEAKESTKATK